MAFPAYLINLDRDPERLAHMSSEFERAGLDFERVPAVLGLAMPDWAKSYFLDSQGDILSGLKPGEVGCYASHLVVAKALLDSGQEHALICEDDCEFPSDLRDVVEASLAVMPEDWDILRLSNPPKAAFRAMAELPGGRSLAVYSRVPNNTGAHLLSRHGAMKLLAPGLRGLAIDEHLRRPWLLGLETYGVSPAPIRSNIFDSTIDAMEDRGLGGETMWRKFRRRRWRDGLEWPMALHWQIRHLGLAGWLRAGVLTLLHSALRKRWPEQAARIRGKFPMPVRG